MIELKNNYSRSIIIFVFFVFAYFIITLNLYLIQILQSSFFSDLARHQYSVTIEQYPERGEIFDCNNNPIALNKTCYSAFVIPYEIKNKPEIHDFIKKHFPEAANRIEEQKNKKFLFVKRHLSDEEVALIENSHLDEIHLLKEATRFYPYATSATICGMTDIDNKGILGIEQSFNPLLAGLPSTVQLQKDARSKHFYFSKNLKQEGQDGESVHLTIDAILQHKIQKILEKSVELVGAKEAGAIIMNPETGAILTSASVPTFDPNNTKSLDIEITKNRPIAQAFECGSTIKTFMALAALEEGVTDLEEPIDCENCHETKIDNIRVRTVVPHGILSFLEVIQKSNNIGTVKIAKRLDKKLYDYYTKIGFGCSTGINLPGEHKGFVNHPSKWSRYSIQSLSYGYELTTTLAQLARAMSIIMNGGYLVQPHITQQKIIEKSGPIISESTHDKLQLILQESVEHGTGWRAKIPGYTVIGKTGTANILENGTYNESRHLYTFIGGIEKNEYKRVIVLYIKDSAKTSYSAVIAAPLFKKIAECLILHENAL